MEPRKVLVLDDDPAIVEALKLALAEVGSYVVETRLSRSVEDVLEVRPDLAIIDAPPGYVGATLNFVQRLRLQRELRTLPLIITTTHLRHIESSLLRDRAIHVLVKPFELDDLLESVDALLKSHPGPLRHPT